MLWFIVGGSSVVEAVMCTASPLTSSWVDDNSTWMGRNCGGDDEDDPCTLLDLLPSRREKGKSLHMLYSYFNSFPEMSNFTFAR